MGIFDRFRKHEKGLVSSTPILKREIVHGRECLLISVIIENDSITILGVISESYPNMIEYRSYRSSDFNLIKGNEMYASTMQSYIDQISYLSEYLNKNGMTDENFEEALYLFCKKNIDQYNRMIDNDLYALIDIAVILKSAITLFYKQPMNELQLRMQWEQLLKSCLPKIKDSVYITKYDLSNPLMPKPYLVRML